MNAPSLALLLLYVVCEPKPLAITMKDASITKCLSTAKLAGIKAELPFKLEGRVGYMRAELRDHIVIVRIERVTVDNDSTHDAIIRSLTMHYNRKTGYASIHAIALGGVIDVTGVWK